MRIKSEKGITLLEVIAVLAILAIVAPFALNYIIDGVKNSNTLTDKIAAQTVTNTLMNQLDKTVTEADIPITLSTAGGSLANGASVVFRKPEGTTVTFTFNKTKSTVRQVEKSGLGVTTLDTSYSNIVGLSIKKVVTNELVNGAEIEVKSKVNQSEYLLKNTYYTRNTVPST